MKFPLRLAAVLVSFAAFAAHAKVVEKNVDSRRARRRGSRS